ncbi:MAG: aldo/keto reductase [Pseudomonadota bacterium]|nr:aldo/keto reductase [Pseudomonadota bacterium]
MKPTRFAVRPGYEISRVIRGGWQLAGGHGTVDRAAAVADLVACGAAGIDTFDCADIYSGVEEIMGALRTEYARRHGAAALAALKVHTKCVPDLDRLATIDRAYLRSIVDRSLRQLRMERLDLVQMHWWDYGVPGYVEAALWLDEFRRDGKIELLGATNFDTARTAELVTAGVPLATMQVQYSLLDARPEHGLAGFCLKHGIRLLCYGSVAGGFLADRWLGKPEPTPPFTNRSLAKYKLIIDDFGGWALFQELLRILREVADRHDTDIASVASRSVLGKPVVAAVIVGARDRSHLERNARLTDFELTAADEVAIAAVLARRKGPDGDAYQHERDRSGRHGSIMNYNLNAAAS